MSAHLLLVLVESAASPRTSASFPWVVSSDWDDTIKAGGHGSLFGIRGIGRRIEGTYPGVTALLAELDPLWSGRDLLGKQPSFQIWSANPFSSKKQTSCSPPLHRKPVTRKGSLPAGIAWVISKTIPEWVPPVTRTWLVEHSAKQLGDVKYKAFRREAAAVGDATEIVFFGDTAQGDAAAGM